MAKPPSPTVVSDTPPGEVAQTTPRDMHLTSDIRLVMIEIAKLSTNVDRLIDDVKDQGKKIDDLRLQSMPKLDRVIDDVKDHGSKIDKLRHQATSIKVGLGVAAVALTLFGWFLDHLIDGKLQTLTALLPAAHK